MRVDGSAYIGSLPTAVGVVSLCTGSPSIQAVDSMISRLNNWQPHLVMDRGRRRARIVIGNEVSVLCRDGSIAVNTIICEIVEPTENELGEVPCLN